MFWRVNSTASVVGVVLTVLLAATVSGCQGSGGGTAMPGPGPVTGMGFDDTMPSWTGAESVDIGFAQGTGVADDEVTAIRGDGTGGFEGTWEGRTVHLPASSDRRIDGQRAWFRRFDYPEVDGDESLWKGEYREYGLWSVPGASGFAHFRVKGWRYEKLRAPDPNEIADGYYHRIVFGYVVHGDPTGPDMPASGGARYSGRAEALVWDNTATDLRGGLDIDRAERYQGSLELEAVFGASAASIAGSIGDLRHRLGGGEWTRRPGEFSIGGGTIAGGAFSATLSGEGFTGDANGRFYGPGAAEVGGVLRGTRGDQTLSGWFGGGR